MSFRRPHPRQRRTCEEHKAELEEENYHLRSELQTEVATNRQNERRINQLERDYARCEQKIQNLNREIECLENASEEEIVELKSEISSLKRHLYQARKDVRDKEKYISTLEKQLVESEEQVENLRYRIKTISSRKNSPERGNSPDLYNSDDNMATITELANAIDGYVDIRATTRDILIDQIKRATRQIRRKENNLRQDIIREQRRRYDAEAERDVCTRERDDVIGERDMAILAYNNERKESRRWMFSYRDKDRRVQGLLREKFAKQLLHQRDTDRLQQNTRRLQTNAQNQVNRMLVIITRKQTRIGELLREKFVFQLVIRQREQNILNLQGQILALQNNPPNQINMAGIPHPYFDWDDSIPDFLAQLRLDLQNRGIDPAGAGANGRAQALGHLRACMRGRTLK